MIFCHKIALNYVSCSPHRVSDSPACSGHSHGGGRVTTPDTSARPSFPPRVRKSQIHYITARPRSANRPKRKQAAGLSNPAARKPLRYCRECPAIRRLTRSLTFCFVSLCHGVGRRNLPAARLRRSCFRNLIAKTAPEFEGRRASFFPWCRNAKSVSSAKRAAGINSRRSPYFSISVNVTANSASDRIYLIVRRSTQIALCVKTVYFSALNFAVPVLSSLIIRKILSVLVPCQNI